MSKIEIRASRETRMEYLNPYGDFEEIEVWEIESVRRYPNKDVDWRDVNTVAETRCEKVKDIIVEALRKAVEEGRYA
ncbi:MAG: hypothetical protein Q4B94_00160 [Pseudomonadota bacterium]|nr:hypothetical protein [Pseudomonadota bacterium]